MKKKIIAIFLAALMVLSVVPVASFAASVEDIIKVEPVSLQGFDAAYRYYADVDETVKLAAKNCLKAIAAGTDPVAAYTAAPQALKDFVAVYCGNDPYALINTKYTFIIENPSSADYELYGTDVEAWINSGFETIPAELRWCEDNVGDILENDAPNLLTLLALGEFTCAVKNKNVAGNEGCELEVALNKKTSSEGEYQEVPNLGKSFTFTTDLPIKVEEIAIAGYDVAYRYYIDVDASVIAAAKNCIKAIVIDDEEPADAYAAAPQALKDFVELYCGGDAMALLNTTYKFNVTKPAGAKYKLYGTDVESWIKSEFATIPAELKECPKDEGDILDGYVPNLLLLLALGEFKCAVKNNDFENNSGLTLDVKLNETVAGGETKEITSVAKSYKFKENIQLVKVEPILIDGYDMAYLYTANVDMKVTEAARIILRAAIDDGIDPLVTYAEIINNSEYAPFKELVNKLGGTSALYTKYNFEVENVNSAVYELYGTDVEAFYLTGNVPEELRKCDETEGQLVPDNQAPNLLMLFALREFRCAVKNLDPEGNGNLVLNVELFENYDVPELKKSIEEVKKTFTFPKSSITVTPVTLEGYDAAYIYKIEGNNEGIQAGAKACLEALEAGTLFTDYEQIFLDYPDFASYVNAYVDEENGATLYDVFTAFLAEKYNFNVVNADKAVYKLYATDVEKIMKGETPEELAVCAKTEGKLLTEKEMPNKLVLLALGEVTCAIKSGVNTGVTKDRKIQVELLENGQKVDVQEYTVAHNYSGKWAQKDGKYYQKCADCGVLGCVDEDGRNIVGGLEATRIIGTQYLDDSETADDKAATSRYIILLDEEAVSKYNSIKVVVKGYDGSVAKASVEEAYTSFVNDEQDITAADLGCEAMAIITMATPVADNCLAKAYGVLDSGAEVLLGARVVAFYDD